MSNAVTASPAVQKNFLDVTKSVAETIKKILEDANLIFDVEYKPVEFWAENRNKTSCFVDGGVDKAYEIWQAADKRIREEALCSREEIEENLSQVGVDFRLTPWPKNDDGTQRKNYNLIPFLRLCIPRTGQDALKARFQEYLKDNPFGKKRRTPAQVQRELKAVTNKLFILDDLHREGAEIVRWWMNQEAFDPLSFPKDSYGDLAKRALGLAEPEEEPKKG